LNPFVKTKAEKPQNDIKSNRSYAPSKPYEDLLEKLYSAYVWFIYNICIFGKKEKVMTLICISN
jgi:hypothetical protein